MQQVNRRADPAPSRWSYKAQRLWLTPVVRALLRTGLPAFVLIVAVGGYLGDATRRDALWAQVDMIKRDFQSRPEFMVRLMALDGASPETQAQILTIFPEEFPVSSFDLDLGMLRDEIRKLDAVADASLHVRSGGVLQVDVTERMPVALWRGPDGLELVDGDGVRAGLVNSRAARPDLPLIAGKGANAHVAQAMELVAIAAPLQGRLRGLVRVGGRRWDMVLDREQRILLPRDHPQRALERVVALAQAKDLLARDVAAIDMRLATRPTVRMTPDAQEELLRIREIVKKGAQ